MPWKQGYTISDEKSLADSDLRWPDGNRCCFSITVDLSVARGPDGISAKDLATPNGYFAANGGLDHILGVLRRRRLTATFAVPAVIAEIYPARIRALSEEGHEVAAGGFRHEDVSGLLREDEKARIDATTEILAKLTGQRPEGWFSLPRPDDKFAGGTISPNTMELLIEAGYAWFGNGLADDIPHYWVTDFARKRALLALPYYYAFDDQFFLMFPAKGTGLENADSLFRNWRAEFDAQYKRGRQFSMVLHPQGSGWANRLERLDRFLEHVRGFPGVWNPTASACARHWEATYPKTTHLKLEPSIWADYPGSLS